MKNLKWIITALVLVGLIVGASLLYSTLAGEVENDNLVVENETLEDSEDDFPAPDFTVLDRGGNEVKLSDFKGKPIVLNFWATWCHYCVEEMPDFNKASELYPDVQFVMVNATDGVSETVEKATAYVDGEGFGFDVFFDTKQEAVSAYRVSAFPQTYFISPEGELAAKGSGMLSYEKLLQGIGLIVPEKTEQVTVSPLSEIDLLEPVESLSWEREYPPEYVMLHFTSAVMTDRDEPYDLNDVKQIFRDSEVSINYIVDREGKIYCYIPEDRVAWHAGKGSFGEDERLTNAMNKYSIGIEILAIGSSNDMAQYMSYDEYASLDSSLIGFTDAQYESLKTLVSDVCERNSILFDREHVIGHDEYNFSKNDPGELFDWSRLFDK